MTIEEPNLGHFQTADDAYNARDWKTFAQSFSSGNMNQVEVSTYTFSRSREHTFTIASTAGLVARNWKGDIRMTLARNINENEFFSIGKELD